MNCGKSTSSCVLSIDKNGGTYQLKTMKFVPELELRSSKNVLLLVDEIESKRFDSVPGTIKFMTPSRLKDKGVVIIRGNKAVQIIDGPNEEMDETTSFSVHYCEGETPYLDINTNKPETHYSWDAFMDVGEQELAAASVYSYLHDEELIPTQQDDSSVKYTPLYKVLEGRKDFLKNTTLSDAYPERGKGLVFMIKRKEEILFNVRICTMQAYQQMKVVHSEFSTE